jgi:hypothetical protein
MNNMWSGHYRTQRNTRRTGGDATDLPPGRWSAGDMVRVNATGQYRHKIGRVTGVKRAPKAPQDTYWLSIEGQTDVPFQGKQLRPVRTPTTTSTEIPG